MTSNVFPLILIRAAGLPFSAAEPLRGDFSAAFRRLRTLHLREKALHQAALQSLTDALAALPESPLRTTVYNLRRALYHRRAQARSLAAQLPATHPFHPEIARLHQALHAWQQAVVEKSDTEHDIRRAHDRVAQKGLLALQNIAAQSDTLHRALLFTSQDLLRALPGFAQKPLSDWGKKERAVALSVAEYLSRAVFKTTPLSRLGTVGVERGGAGGEVNPLSHPKPLVTPNVQLLPLLYEVLLREPTFFRSLSVGLNPSFQVTLLPNPAGTACPDMSGEFRDTPRTWLYFDGERESFQHTETHPVTDWLTQTLLQADRKMPYTHLLSRLEQVVEASTESLQNLVFEWIDIGLLEWQLPERGLSPGWCGSLYQYLGYLPSAQVLTDAAFLLQWLRTAARALPFQAVEEAQATQNEAWEQVSAFFQKYDCPVPPLAVEQLFYEDVERPVQVDVPPEAMQRMVTDLTECWQQRGAKPLPPFRARLFDFAQTVLAPGEGMDFLSFCRPFLEGSAAFTPSGLGPLMAEDDKPLAVNGAGSDGLNTVLPVRGKIGATVQIFKENGQYRAVVNGLFVGGGKLFARWLHLLPTDFREAVEARGGAVQFGWQGWSNANFQPLLADVALAVPGGRIGPKSGGITLPLADFEVRLSELGIPQLVHCQSGEAMVCTDLGLEAPETRPPALQVLWHLTVPHVSLEMLLPGTTGRREETWGWRSPRISWRSLVLQRQGWELRPDVWQRWAEVAGPDADFFLAVRPALQEMEVPSRFFAQFPQLRQPPQQVDCDSPVMMRVFRKMLALSSGPLVLTEMLPLPEQCTMQHGEERATEFVLEFSVV